MSLTRPRTRIVLAAVLTLAGAAQLHASELGSCGPRDMPNEIYPGDPRWTAQLQSSGSGAITATNPRSGNGSLELAVTGNLFDWAFFQRIAENGNAWGLLANINCLSMDWWRDAYALAPDAPWYLSAETWQEQTPVLRLLVRDDVEGLTTFSQLVWERWYNTRDALVPTDNGQWNFENLTGQQFWRHFDTGAYTNAGCANGDFTSSGALQTFDLNGWVTNCYSSSAEVYGIMVGLGSMWPGDYHGFVDNVQLGFNNQENFAVEDNFEFDGPVSSTPEPSSIILLGTGLLAMAGAGYLKRRRTTE